MLSKDPLFFNNYLLTATFGAYDSNPVLTYRMARYN